MCNYVTNILTINGNEKQVAEVREYIKGSCGEAISFPSILPIPENMNGKRKVNVKLGSKVFSLPDWMECRIRYWGTTSDAIPIEDNAVKENNRIIFNTASSTPIQAISMLSLLFPEIPFNIIFSDENAGEYSGEYTFEGGELMDAIWFTDDSDKAMEYYFRTHEYDRASWKKGEGGKWVNIYEDEEEQ